MRGIDLKEWRARHGYTQEALRMALGLGSRQTIISWEQSEDALPALVRLALIALEFAPDKSLSVAGLRLTAAEYSKMRKRSTEPSARARRA